MTKKTTERAEFRTQLVKFDTELVEFAGKKVLEMTFTNADIDTGKHFTYSKYFGVLKSDGLDFAIFKASRVFEKSEAEYKSFAIYGEKGLIKSLQEQGKITAEI